MHAPCHNLRCQSRRHTQPITAHFKDLLVQLHLAAGLQIRAYRVKAENRFHPRAECLLRKKTTDSMKMETPQRVCRQKAAHTHTRRGPHSLAEHVWSAAWTGSCSVRGSSEVIKLREGLFSGQISTGSQRESVESSPLLYRDHSTRSISVHVGIFF